MDKLISMTDFTIQNQKNTQSDAHSFFVCVQYAKFLKQPLELWMFVPCKLADGIWVVLEEPVYNGVDEQYYEAQREEYQEAKERVLFEGFMLDGKYLWHKDNLFMISDNISDSFSNRSIEFLLSCYKIKPIELTPTAQKQIGL